MQKGLFFFLLMFVFVACGSSGTSFLIPDPDHGADASYVALRMIDSDGMVQVEIPLAAFGSTATDLEGSTFDIAVNGSTRNSDVDPTEYYVEEVDLIAFGMHDLVDGDVVTFTIYTAAGGLVYYEGFVSATEDSAAPLIVSPDAGTE